MKIITLNTWGGRAGKENLFAFFQKYKDTVDVFCLQEMWSAPYAVFEGYSAGGQQIKHENIMTQGVQEISAVLPDFEVYFRPHFLDNYGIAIFVRKSLTIVEEGEVFVHKHKEYMPEGDLGHHARNIQYIKFETERTPLTVINFHGLWNGKGKYDSDDRINQSKNILEFTKNISGDFVLCGDFNLLPETESIRMFEANGLRNLIKEYGVTSTRTSFYTKEEKYADYVFVTNSLAVKDFSVLPDEVSDHSALSVEL